MPIAKDGPAKAMNSLSFAASRRDDRLMIIVSPTMRRGNSAKLAQPTCRWSAFMRRWIDTICTMRNASHVIAVIAWTWNASGIALPIGAK